MKTSRILIVLTMLCLLLGAGYWLWSGRRIPAPRNIIVITLDTTRARSLTPFNNTLATSPFLDSLARDGVLFTQCISQSNGTNPAHSSLFTGLYCSQHQVFDNHSPLAERFLRIFELAGENGMVTGACVAVPHLGPKLSGLDKGVASYWAPSDEQCRAETVTDHALEFLARQQGKPFFLWVHYFCPHTPYTPDDNYRRLFYQGDRSDPGKTSMQAIYAHMDAHRPNQANYLRKWIPADVTDADYVKAGYLGEIRYMDEQMQRLVNHVRQGDGGDATAMFIIADHGECMDEKNTYFGHHTLYEFDIHVPLVLAYPCAALTGKRIDRLVQTIDVAPTICELMGWPVPAAFEGQSLLPLVRGKTAAFDQRRVVVESGHHAMIAIRDSRYKYIYNRTMMSHAPCRHELYDLHADPAENNNLVWSEKALALHYEDLYKQFRRAYGTGKRAKAEQPKAEKEQEKQDEKALKNLRALGYFE